MEAKKVVIWQDPKYLVIGGILRAETEKGFLLDYGLDTAWFPKAKCKWDADKQQMSVPEWLIKAGKLFR